MAWITAGPWAANPPDPPTDARMCRLYGKVTDLSGRPVPFFAFSFRLQAGAPYGGASAASMVPAGVSAVSDREGLFQVDLPRSTSVVVTYPSAKDPVPFRVPDTDVAALTDVLYPYPVRLEWFFSDGEEEPTYSSIPQDPPGFAELEDGVDHLLVLGVVWSDCRVVALSNPNYLESGWASLELIDSTTLRGQVVLGTDATIQSNEEAFHPGEGGMWARAGYDSSQFAPHFFPDSDYLLTDTAALTFTPV